MEKEQFYQILERYRSGKANPEEVAFLEAYYKALASHPEFDGSLQGKQFWFDMKAEIDSRIDSHLKLRAKASAPKNKRYKLWPKIAVTAAVAVIVFGIWFYTNEIASVPGNDVAYNNDIAPGKNTATLILANGEIIKLDTNKTSVVVSDSVKAMTMLVASTPRGGTYQVVLPDGTQVWLNAASSLKFPSKFSGRERVVELKGEAYMEVVRDKAHPFVVKSAGQEVQVLGTRFNINSYADEGSTKTTLIEGSVNVNGTILKPNQQATNRGGVLTVEPVDPSVFVAWKNNKFIFENDDIKYIMRQIERWYNVDVVYEEVPSEKFVGSLSRFDHISAVLRILEKTGKVHFRVEGRKVFVRN